MIEARIAEIDGEAAKLRSALGSLAVTGPASSSRSVTLKSRRAPRKKRAPRGQRREQFLAAVRKAPGSGAAELGKAIGVSTNQAYALSQRLVQGGEVKKSGKGFKPA
jgi:hypothetical protein